MRCWIILFLLLSTSCNPPQHTPSFLKYNQQPALAKTQQTEQNQTTQHHNTPTALLTTTQPISTTNPPQPSPDQPHQQQHIIELRDNQLLPTELTITEGEYITWVNRDDTSHRISGAGFHSPTLGWSEWYRTPFPTPGTYPYQCELHPNLIHGIIHVIPATPEFTPTDPEIHIINITEYGYQPNTLIIQTGGVVLWINNHPKSSTSVSGAGFESKAIRSQGRFFHQFNKSGIYPYGSTHQKNFYGNITVIKMKD